MNEEEFRQKVIDKIGEIYNSFPKNIEINDEIDIKKVKEYFSHIFNSIDSLYEYYVSLKKGGD